MPMAKKKKPVSAPTLASLGTDESRLARRAMRAWYTTDATTAQPAAKVEKRGGLWYVVLRGAGAVVAVYRLKNDGQLRRMRRWPKTIA